MPLLALNNGNPVIAADFPLPEWREEKGRNRRGEVEYHCEYCNEKMTLATSPIGTPYFMHYPNSRCPNSKHEGDEHRRLKVAVYLLCKKAGWETTVEAHPPDRSWRADVLATKGDRRVAFEIQIYPISGERLQERAEKYRAAGIESVWLLDKFPKRCPYEIPTRTYVVGWKRRPNEKIPEHVTSDYPENLIEVYCLYKQTATATTSEPLTYWAELRAMLAVFDPADPDRQAMILRGQRTTLIELVTRYLAGDLARELDSSHECGIDLEKLYREQAEAAEAQREDLIYEVYDLLTAREIAAMEARIAAEVEETIRQENEARAKTEREAQQKAEREAQQRATWEAQLNHMVQSNSRITSWEVNLRFLLANRQLSHEVAAWLQEQNDRELIDRILNQADTDDELARIQKLQEEKREAETIQLSTYHRFFWWVYPDMFGMDAALQREREERRAEEEQAHEQAIEGRRRFWASYHGTEATLQRARYMLGMLGAPVYGPASAVVHNRRAIYQEPRA